MVKLAALFALVVSLACASRSPASGSHGVFRFTERVDDAFPPVTLQGTVTLANGFAELDLHNRPCRYHERSTKQTAVFDCDDIAITIDVPMSRASYSVATLIRRPVRECTQYQTASTGERICVNWVTRYEERPGRVRGRLHLIREAR